MYRKPIGKATHAERRAAQRTVDAVREAVRPRPAGGGVGDWRQDLLTAAVFSDRPGQWAELLADNSHEDFCRMRGDV